MSFQGQSTDDAADDLEEICDYIGLYDLSVLADYVLEQIENAFQGLARDPLRGNYPRELLDIRTRDYREVFFKPYRLIYQVLGYTVYVLVIADGRRDMQGLLQQRFLRA